MTNRIVLPLSLIVGMLATVPAPALATTPVPAAAPSAAAAPAAATLVAVVDIRQIFDGHPMFQARMESLQQQLKSLDQQFGARQQELGQRSRQLADLNPQSEDYRRQEADLARKAADLQVETRQTREQFLKREAAEYYAAYQDILRAVHQVAQQHRIALVLRCDNSKTEPNNPQAVTNQLNQSVILHRDLDITQLVINQLQLSVARNN